MGILARLNAVGQECPTYFLRLNKALGYHIAPFQGHRNTTHPPPLQSKTRDIGRFEQVAAANFATDPDCVL